MAAKTVNYTENVTLPNADLHAKATPLRDGTPWIRRARRLITLTGRRCRS